MSVKTEKQRITVKLKSPNPLFEKWLLEWREKAKESKSKMQYIFSDALRSLRKYPLPLNSGKDCIILKGFGSKLCDMLDKKLTEYDKNKNNTNNIEFIYSHSTQFNFSNNEKTSQKRPKDPKNNFKSSKFDRPAMRSGAYAILLTLLNKSKECDSFVSSLTKSEIIEYGQHLCDKSFYKREPGSNLTAWSSMTTLVANGLVFQRGCPRKFFLSEDGKKLALTLTEDSEVIPAKLPSNNLEICNESKQRKIETSKDKSQEFDQDKYCTQEKSSQNPNTDSIIFAPYSFEVILLIDTAETAGEMNAQTDELLSEFQKLNVNFEVRRLNVGDFTWICRDKQTNTELVLPYIVERKRMDDLGHSIKDGRFHEQKFRLKQCGIQNAIYIVESFGNNIRTGLPLGNLMQGATNTLIQDQFQVKFTDNLRHTIHYLSGLTFTLKYIFEKKTLMGCKKEDYICASIEDDLLSLITYDEFNKSASKSRHFKIKELFIRQLLQLKGVSVEKAIAIAEKYPTPKLLKEAIDRAGTDGDKLLATIQFGPLKKAIGPAISHTIFQLFSINKLF